MGTNAGHGSGLIAIVETPADLPGLDLGGLGLGTQVQVLQPPTNYVVRPGAAVATIPELIQAGPIGLALVQIPTGGGGGGITPTEHELLRQLIHLADGVGGPMDGWPSGAVRDTLPFGSPFPTEIVWWSDATRTKKIVQKDITFAGPFPTLIRWAVYDATGLVVLATVTDAISYSGPFETSRTRTVT
jgi:hypothetical protein